MKYYIASKLENHAEHNRVRDALNALGHEKTTLKNMNSTSVEQTPEERASRGVPSSDWLGVTVEMRSAHPPYKTWQEQGYGPFDMHGETFAVTRNVGALDSPNKWRVSHVATGIAVPHTEAETKEQARAEAVTVLTKVGPTKLRDALAKARDLIASA